MFNQVLFVALMVPAVSLLVGADQCSLYGDADAKYHRCMDYGLFTIKRTSSSDIMHTYSKGCRNLAAFTSCMEEWSRNCADKAEIMDAVHAVGAPCNGTEVADWIRDKVAPTYDKITYECKLALAAMPICKAALKDLNVYPGYRAATAEGIQLVKTYFEARYDCFKQDVQDIVPNASACSNVTWEDVFFYNTAVVYDGQPSETLGRVLTNAQLNEIKAMAAASN